MYWFSSTGMYEQKRADLFLILFCLTFSGHLEALTCYNCSRAENTCRDETFVHQDQLEVNCDKGRCVSIIHAKNGDVDRYCDMAEEEPGCFPISDGTFCACRLDLCNGPDLAISTVEGTGRSTIHKKRVATTTTVPVKNADVLKCYFCWRSTQCTDEMFDDDPPDCADGYGDGRPCLTDCSGGSCVKYDKYDDTTERYCSEQWTEPKCERRAYGVFCSCSDGDGCNNAFAISVTIYSFIWIIVCIIF